MKRISRLLCMAILMLGLLSSNLVAAESSGVTRSVSTDHAIAGQDYVLIIVGGEIDHLSLTEYDDSILCIRQKKAESSTLSFENVQPADFEMATAFIISEEGLLTEVEVLENIPEHILFLPANIKTIDEGAFDGVSATIVKIPDGLIAIRKEAFANCPQLRQVHIPASVTEIEENVFLNSPNVAIYGYANSEAEEYARQNGIRFVNLDS